MFSSIDLSLVAVKMRQKIDLSQAAFDMILKDRWRLPKRIFRLKIDDVGSLKRVFQKIFKLIVYVIEASKL
jgi:hypothetical protein